MIPAAPEIDPLQALSLSPPPTHTEAAAEQIARCIYGIEGSAKLVTGEVDQSFRIASGTAVWTLKIFNRASQIADIALVTDMLTSLEASASVCVPRVRPALDGARWTMIKEGPAAGHVTQMRSWLSGEPLYGRSLSCPQRKTIGKTLGRIAVDLSQGFVKAPPPRRNLIWDIREIGRLWHMLAPSWPGTTDDRAVIQDVVARYETETAPLLRMLPVQPIHNDFNPSNILIDPDSGDIRGVIDFGDAVIAPAVQDLAVACAYHVAASGDALAPVLDVVRGYTRLCAMRPGEATLLPHLIRARLALTLIVAEWRAERHPQNRDYIRRNVPQARAALSAIAAMKAGAMDDFIAECATERMP